MIEFSHKPPTGYSYEQVPFKSNVVAIWIHNHYRFVYNGGGVTRSIWGFYNTKTKYFHSPVNSKTIGDQVDIERTTPYSAMIPKLSPLELAYV
jgi:hypothetical protein